MRAAFDPLLPEMPPTQDELPYDDGKPMETIKHRHQMNLLCEQIDRHFSDRPQVFCGGNMAVYYSVLQARNNDFLVPDFFIVMDAIVGRERKSWVVWEENAQAPDIVIELLSPTTEDIDRGRKMQIYAGLKVREYYLFDPDTLRLEGYLLDADRRAYAPMAADARGELTSRILGFKLGLWQGEQHRMPSTWLRWKHADGTVMPTYGELEKAKASEAEAKASEAQAKASEAQAKASEAQAKASEAEARANEAAARAERLAARLRALGVNPEE